MIDTEKLSRQMRFLEETIASAEVRSSREAMATLLSDDFREFGASGRIFDKKEILSFLESEAAGDSYLVEKMAVTVLGQDTALVTYHIPSRTEDGLAKAASNRCSIWRMEDGVWQLLFHQGTRC